MAVNLASFIKDARTEWVKERYLKKAFNHVLVTTSMFL